MSKRWGTPTSYFLHTLPEKIYDDCYVKMKTDVIIIIETILIKLPISEEISPLSRLLETSKPLVQLRGAAPDECPPLKLIKLYISSGNSPVKLLLFKWSIMRLVRSPISGGIEPVNKLLDNSILSKFIRFPSSGGMEPVS